MFLYWTRWIHPPTQLRLSSPQSTLFTLLKEKKTSHHCFSAHHLGLFTLISFCSCSLCNIISFSLPMWMTKNVWWRLLRDERFLACFDNSASNIALCPNLRGWPWDSFTTSVWPYISGRETEWKDHISLGRSISHTCTRFTAQCHDLWVYHLTPPWHFLALHGQTHKHDKAKQSHDTFIWYYRNFIRNTCCDAGILTSENADDKSEVCHLKI